MASVFIIQVPTSPAPNEVVPPIRTKSPVLFRGVHALYQPLNSRMYDAIEYFHGYRFLLSTYHYNPHYKAMYPQERRIHRQLLSLQSKSFTH